MLGADIESPCFGQRVSFCWLVAIMGEAFVMRRSDRGHQVSIWSIGCCMCGKIIYSIFFEIRSPLVLQAEACDLKGARSQNRRLGGRAQRPNREIVSFRSCVRAVLDVRWECPSNLTLRVFPFPFWPREAFPFPLRTPPSPQSPIQL